MIQIHNAVTYSHISLLLDPYQHSYLSICVRLKPNVEFGFKTLMGKSYRIFTDTLHILKRREDMVGRTPDLAAALSRLPSTDQSYYFFAIANTSKKPLQMPPEPSNLPSDESIPPKPHEYPDRGVRVKIEEFWGSVEKWLKKLYFSSTPSKGLVSPHRGLYFLNFFGVYGR